MVRPRHPKKDIEKKVLGPAEEQGWRVERASNYFKMYCPCVEKHKKDGSFDTVQSCLYDEPTGMATEEYVLEGALMRLVVIAEYRLEGQSGLSDEQFDQQGDAVMEELLRLKALDPSVGGSMARREMEIEVYVEASTLDEAFSTGASQIRTALHSAGVDTSNWPYGEPTYWLGLGQHPDTRLLSA